MFYFIERFSKVILFHPPECIKFKCNILSINLTRTLLQPHKCINFKCIILLFHRYEWINLNVLFCWQIIFGYCFSHTIKLIWNVSFYWPIYRCYCFTHENALISNDFLSLTNLDRILFHTHECINLKFFLLTD